MISTHTCVHDYTGTIAVLYTSKSRLFSFSLVISDINVEAQESIYISKSRCRICFTYQPYHLFEQIVFCNVNPLGATFLENTAIISKVHVSIPCNHFFQHHQAPKKE